MNIHIQIFNIHIQIFKSIFISNSAGGASRPAEGPANRRGTAPVGGLGMGNEGRRSGGPEMGGLGPTTKGPCTCIYVYIYICISEYVYIFPKQCLHN